MIVRIVIVHKSKTRTMRGVRRPSLCGFHQWNNQYIVQPKRVVPEFFSTLNLRCSDKQWRTVSGCPEAVGQVCQGHSGLCSLRTEQALLGLQFVNACNQ